MIRAAIIDDEELAIHTLVRLLGELDTFEITGTYTDPVQGLLEIVRTPPDVVFLDIEMPVLNGFEIAKQLSYKELKTKVVFVTAFDEYAVQAFEVNSLDYLLKPVTRERLEKTVQKLRTQESHLLAQDTIDHAISAAHMKLNRIVVNENERLIIVDPVDISYFTVDGSSVKICTGQKSYTVRETLGYWEERMEPFDFFRCHKSFLVNLQKIREIHLMFNNTYVILLSDCPEKVPVSRRYAAQLKEILGI